MNGHHLILGQLTDFVSGRRLPDTHDERYRQKLARWLVQEKGFAREALRPQTLEVRLAGKSARIPVTWTVWHTPGDDCVLRALTEIHQPPAEGGGSSPPPLSADARHGLRPLAVIGMIVQYGPGSLVTRHRPALAMGRLVAPYQVPRVVVSNGENADILDGRSGRVLAGGLEGIPSFAEFTAVMADHDWSAPAEQRLAMERRIVMAFEVDDRCPCDTTIGRTPCQES